MSAATVHHSVRVIVQGVCVAMVASCLFWGGISLRAGLWQYVVLFALAGSAFAFIGITFPVVRT